MYASELEMLRIGARRKLRYIWLLILSDENCIQVIIIANCSAVAGQNVFCGVEHSRASAERESEI